MYLYISSSTSSPSLISLLSSRITVIVCLLPVLLQQRSGGCFVGATVGDKCNFDKYETGCYSRANVHCDLGTYECVCMPETPVLIDKRLCVKKLKENETCQYNEQCDNEQGFYCSYSDHKLLNNCLKGDFYPSTCKCIKVNLKQQKQNNPHNSYNNNRYHSSQKSSRSSHQHQNQNNNSSSQLPNNHSYSPRLVWISLLVVLVGLILLLLMIKSEFYRIRSLPRQEDRISINSEADVPPPYEVAIRMKL